MNDSPTLKAELCVPFPTAEQAEVAYNSLRVDKEPKKTQVTRDMEVKGQHLIVNWTATEARYLRVSTGSFLDHLCLVIETIKMFESHQS